MSGAVVHREAPGFGILATVDLVDNAKRTVIQLRDRSGEVGVDLILDIAPSAAESSLAW
jgi:hypothetical protein